MLRNDCKLFLHTCRIKNRNVGVLGYDLVTAAGLEGVLCFQAGLLDWCACSALFSQKSYDEG